mgnify:CR=1 FL=1
MRKPEPQRNVLNANLQPITNQQNSATLSQPKVIWRNYCIAQIEFILYFFIFLGSENE